MANFIRAKLGKRRSRTSLTTGGSGTIDDEDEDPAYRDFASSSHYMRKHGSLTGQDGSPPSHQPNVKISSDHSDSTGSDDSEQNLTVEDYTQPVDAIVPNLSLTVSNTTSPPIPTPSDEDYTEPYEAKKAVEEFDCKQGSFPESHLKPLAKKGHSIQNGSAGSKKSHSPKKGNLKSHPKHSPIVEEDTVDNYDKLISPMLPAEPPNPSYGKLYGYAGKSATRTNDVTYHAPWDKGDVVRDFEKKIQATSPSTSPLHLCTSSVTNGAVDNVKNSISTNVSLTDSNVTYCQPWDLGNTKEQFKSSIAKVSMPSKDKKLLQQKSVDIPLSRHPMKKQMSHSGLSDSTKSGDTMVYDAPWDNAEKQKELEERLKSATIAPVRRGTDGVYEEPWDVGSRGKAISDMLNNSGENKSPSKRSPTTTKDAKHKSRSSSQLELGGGKAWNVIGEPIDPTLPLREQPWYHGTIGRLEAESMLRVCKEGSYLVRNSESTKESYSLSMKSAKGFIHIKIEFDSANRFILGENSQPFDCIPDMIYHYSRNLLPIKGADHMILLHPVLKEHI